jgi:hypothetical protein
MEELNIAERILGILMFSWFLSPSEIAEFQQGKFTKTIVATFLSTLVAAHSDIQYFIANYPQRAIAILFAGMIIVFIYAKHSNILKKIKRKIKKLNKMILIYFNKILDFLYFSETDEYIEKIERKSLSFGQNNFRLLFVSILAFGHYTLNFLNPSFIVILLSILFLGFLLSLGREISKHPFRMFIGSVLTPWITSFFAYFISKDIGVQPLFLEDEYLVSHLGMNTSDWLGATIKFSIFTSTSLFFGLVFFAISSMSLIFILKKGIELIISLLGKTPIFYRQERKAKIR